MGFTYEEKQSVSPLVDFIWRTEDLTDGVMLHQPTPLGLTACRIINFAFFLGFEAEIQTSSKVTYAALCNFHSVSRWNLTRKALNCLLNVYPLRILRTAK